MVKEPCRRGSLEPVDFLWLYYGYAMAILSLYYGYTLAVLWLYYGYAMAIAMAIAMVMLWLYYCIHTVSKGIRRPVTVLDMLRKSRAAAAETV